MLQQLLELLHGLVVLVLRREVDLCEDDEEGDLQEEAQSDVLLGHLLQAHIGADHHASEIRSEAS